MILKPCPFCGKSIPRAIKVCPYCHLDEQGQVVQIDTAVDEVAAATGKAFENDLQGLSSRDPFKREQAVISMSRRGFGVVQALVTILSDHSKPGLAAIARVLGRIRDRRAITALVQAVKLGDPDLRMAALGSLVQFREPEVLPTLLNEAERPDPITQSYLTYMLGSFPDGSVEPVLERLARHSNREVAFQAVYALGQMGDPRAIPALRAAARRRDAVVREAALASLRRLGVTTLPRSRFMVYGMVVIMAGVLLVAGLWAWHHLR